MPDPADPLVTLCATLKDHGVEIDPAVLGRALHDLGLTLDDPAQAAAHRQWERKLRNGELSERKIIGRPQ